MQVTIHLRSDVAKMLRANALAGDEALSLQKLLHEMQVRLLPLHPDSSDFELSRHFYVHVSSDSVAKVLVKKLLNEPAVEAAYVKPPDSTPSF